MATSPEDERDCTKTAPAEEERESPKVVDPETFKYPEVSTPVEE